MTAKLKIISGGQTGVDRAALDAAIELGIPCGGWCPKGRKAEDGPLDPKYPLKETDCSDYAVRTEWNVRDSDGTLIVTRGKPTGGTAYTIAMARVHKKPCLVIDLDKLSSPRKWGPREETLDPRLRGDDIVKWLTENNISNLNIAGPRESNMRGIYNDAKEYFKKWLFSRSSG